MPAKTAKPSSPLTAQDIAELAEVSVMTVSRYFNAPEKLAATTRARIQRIVSETGYTINQAASSLRLNRSQLVAAIFPSLSSPIFNDTITALTATLNQQGFQLMIGQSGYDLRQEERLLGTILGRRPDGIILTGTEHSQATRNMLQNSDIPVVEIWDISSPPLDISVGFSHAEVGTAVAQHLHESARRRPATIGADDTRSLIRCRAFSSSIAAHQGQAAPIITVPAPATLASARAATRQLLAQHPDTDAIFCNSDLIAMGALIEAGAAGLDVPSRLAVIGFGDLTFLQGHEPAISSVRVDAAAIGEQAALRLMQRIRHGLVESPVTDLGFSIVRRATS
ncbi:LacI family DNA-binding transcriptional regulator [Kerstersia gyiorum]|uniref:HTH lacI-type domain-containing protein n=1 Tax=Kerstersia gyiorum TaxID=206506 RepID=A0A171KUG6_9BURK|nr:LacI family DNA-binding transcriptional regulator [Kerstersia gyiorum]KKO72533.1 hypothetical protein AAV32_05690 [Kerstersia gyiorum]